MRIGRYCIALGLLAGLGACSNMMGSGGNSSHAAVTPQPKPLASQMVEKVQSTLRDDGYYKQGNIDGIWGTGTETAVQAFQKDHSLTPSGQLDMPTLQALNIRGGSANGDTAQDVNTQNPPDQAQSQPSGDTNSTQMPANNTSNNNPSGRNPSGTTHQ